MAETHIHPERADRWQRVASLAELQLDEGKVVHVNGQTLALFSHQGKVYAVDNRCPHMGFPLHQGSVKDGVLTCHWHHARFDLTCGGTFDLWADDVQGYPVEVRGEGAEADIWIDSELPERDQKAYYRKRLEAGLKYNLRLVTAKAIIGLLKSGGTPEDALRIGAEFGTLYARNGWGAGLTVLTAMANILPHLSSTDRPRALYQGLTFVARECAGQPPRFPIEPLETQERNPETLQRWFREFVERRDNEGAERILCTAIQIGLPQERIADMIFAACTDHLYRDVGHPLDFANKAFELLDLTGWESAGIVLTSLLGRLIPSSRMEESASWRHPIDLADLLWKAFPKLPTALAEGAATGENWSGQEELADQLLKGEPTDTVEAMLNALRYGATIHELAETVTYSAGRRIAQFHVTNEFGDWDTVLHTFTYANAVQQALRRAPSMELLRGVFDSAMSIYLDRFLNTPATPLPSAKGTSIQLPNDLLALLNGQQQVNEAAQLVADGMDAGVLDAVLLSAIGQCLLREDPDFHTFQCVEAAFRQYTALRGTEWGRHLLIASARYLAAHSPTPRAMGQTYQIAHRLQRGDELYEE
ncbi:hypothetical protein LBMAG21_02030 [Armatimonadota bacterium]|nr:hypothetical protein LBMAG21_02030 [Armatimonadota bacterium]